MHINPNKEFLNKVAQIAVPIALQSVIMSALNMVDQIMVGQLGQNTIAAVGLSNRLIFGKFGFPKLGLEGSAIGTVIARIIE